MQRVEYVDKNGLNPRRLESVGYLRNVLFVFLMESIGQAVQEPSVVLPCSRMRPIFLKEIKKWSMEAFGRRYCPKMLKKQIQVEIDAL